MSKTLVICKTEHLLHNGSLTTERPRIIWHFINKKPEPNFWKCLLGRACWFVSLSLVRDKCSSQFQGKLGLLWRGRRPAPPQRGATRLPVMQQSISGETRRPRPAMPQGVPGSLGLAQWRRPGAGGLPGRTPPHLLASPHGESKQEAASSPGASICASRRTGLA